MNSSIIKQVADEFLNECLGNFLLEESLEVRFIVLMFVLLKLASLFQLTWCIRTNNITLDNLYNLIPLDNLIKEERLVGMIVYFFKLMLV
jgi:hypothetical protein